MQDPKGDLREEHAYAVQTNAPPLEDSVDRDDQST